MRAVPLSGSVIPPARTVGGDAGRDATPTGKNASMSWSAASFTESVR